MKVFLSYSYQDQSIISSLIEALRESNFETWVYEEIEHGGNIFTEIQNAIKSSDVFLAIITDNYMESTNSQAELSAVALGDYNIKLLAIAVGNVIVPGYLNNFVYRRIQDTRVLNIIVLQDLAKLNNYQDMRSRSNLSQKFSDENIRGDDLSGSIKLLKDALNNNQLTLICGSGVSKSSGFPDWNELLIRIVGTHILMNDNNDITAKELLERLPNSNLILGKYLKILLKDDFDKILRYNLYLEYDKSFKDNDGLMGTNRQFCNPSIKTSLIKSIVELSRPRKLTKSIESIITYNFDALLEEALTYNKIENRPIWQEGQWHSGEEIPIYHVHGYLSHNDKIDNPNLVFSEDAYHTQFIDPYSWSNLIQLNKFSNNICLFIGISLSDPNMRRLLDISWRKNKRCKHFIIRKRPKNNEKIDKLEITFFEQDALFLGLNVIWISDFDEMPGILNKII
jgi:hypothetical protein